MSSRVRRSNKSVTSLLSARVARARGVTRESEEVPKLLASRAGVVDLDLEEVEEMFTQSWSRIPRVTNPPRPGLYLHVSDLLGKCLRKSVLADKVKMPMPVEQLSDGVALTFHIGDAVHNFVKARAAVGRGEHLYGDWECRCGKLHVTHTLYPEAAEQVCETCGTPANRYRELNILNDELMVTGSPDMLFYYKRHDALLPVEIKSISHDEWKELSRPKPDHLLQVLFYWYLLRESGRRVLPSVVVLYVTKGYVFGSPYKTFVLDAPSVEGRLAPYIAEAKARKVAVEAGVVPARTLCSSPEATDAKKCHLVAACFSRAYP